MKKRTQDALINIYLELKISEVILLYISKCYSQFLTYHIIYTVPFSSVYCPFPIQYIMLITFPMWFIPTGQTFLSILARADDNRLDPVKSRSSIESRLGIGERKELQIPYCSLNAHQTLFGSTFPTKTRITFAPRMKLDV